jgi:tetratricopeptide (TPR) repeat protein
MTWIFMVKKLFLHSLVQRVSKGYRFAPGLFFGFAFFSGVVNAQTIESLQWVGGAGHPVARITFNANVRFVRQTPLAVADFSQIDFQIIAADERVLAQVVEERVRLSPAAGTVAIELSYVGNPKAASTVLNLQFSNRVRLVARQGPGPKAIDLDFAADATSQNASAFTGRLPEAASTPEEKQFAVLLESSVAADQSKVPHIPVEFQKYVVRTRTAGTADLPRFELMVGDFKTEADAQAVQLSALARFPSAKVVKLDAPAQMPFLQGAPSASPVAAIELTSQQQDASPALANSAAQVDVNAQELLRQGQLGLSEKRFQEALDAFNKALLLPPNTSSQSAQELIGQAWEGLKQPSKALMEYQLYLKLYPGSDAASAIRDRFVALGGADTTGSKPEPTAAAKIVPPSYSANGSIAQYYYGGKTKTDSLINISAGIDQNTLSRTNQSALVTNVDVSGRYRSDNSDVRLVLRDTVSKNFMASSNVKSSLNSVYVDYRNLSAKVDWRVGRQSAVGGSLFGLFDGVSMTMPVASKYKFSAMLGSPANTLVSAPSQRLAGVMLEGDGLFEHWGGNVSLVDQTTEGISDRRAVGLEARYFGESMSMFSQMDYDLNFRALNALTLQGSGQGPFDTTLTVLVDNRKAPSLQLSDALISSGTTSLKTLLQLHSLAEVKDLAMGTAAQARQALFSVTRAISPKWQGSVDMRYSDVGALPAVGDFQAMPATGGQVGVSLQLTGSNIYSNRDILSFNVSTLKSDTLHGTQFAINNMTGLRDGKISFEPSIRFYTQTDNTATKVFRVSPGLRLSYKLSERSSVTGETIYEKSKTDGVTNHEDSSSVYFYTGYRYDFY